MKLTAKEAAQLRREKTELEQKRKALKEKLKNHRSELSTDELQASTQEAQQMADRIEEIDEQLEEAPEGTRGMNLFGSPRNTDVTAENYRSSAKYRDAFFRSFMSGKVAEADSEVMAYGKRAVTDVNGLSVTSGGEYLVPETTLNQIQSIIVKYGRLYAAITKYQFNGDVTIPIGTAGSPTNNSDGTDTLNFTFTEATINQQAIVATIAVKNLLMKNSISGLESYLAMEIGKYIGLQLENYLLVGSLSTSKFLGIKTAVTEAPSAAKTYLEMDWEMLAEVLGSLESPYGDDGTFIMNRKTFFTTFFAMTDANGNPLVTIVPNAPAVSGTPGSGKFLIVGMPVIFSTRMSDNEFIFGDLSQYVVNESQELVIEADASAGFAADKTIWRGKVYSGGRPMFAKNAFVYYTKEA